MQDGAPTRILLIQVRAANDVMMDHEYACIRARLGDRPFVLSRHNAVVEKADPRWLDGVDALIIGGSGDFSVHHPKSKVWVDPIHPVVERALKENVPGFAICFGHQLLGKHLGCDVVTDPERSELGTVDVHITESGRRSLFSDVGKTLRVHCGHSDHVVGIPAGVELLAYNDLVESQAFQVRGTQFYSVQFHPDMTGAEARYRYLAYRDGFADRIDPNAMAMADRFIVGQDESVSLIGHFLDLVRAQS